MRMFWFGLIYVALSLCAFLLFSNKTIIIEGEHVSFAGFIFLHLVVSSFLFIISIFDLFVMWEFDTVKEIIQERNVSYAIFIFSLAVVCAAGIIAYR